MFPNCINTPTKIPITKITHETQGVWILSWFRHFSSNSRIGTEIIRCHWRSQHSQIFCSICQATISTKLTYEKTSAGDNDINMSTCKRNVFQTSEVIKHVAKRIVAQSFLISIVLLSLMPALFSTLLLLWHFIRHVKGQWSMRFLWSFLWLLWIWGCYNYWNFFAAFSRENNTIEQYNHITV